MDQEISKISNTYLLALSKFQTTLKQRNSLLKQQTVNQLLLDTLDENISKYEFMIIQERKNFIDNMCVGNPDDVLFRFFGLQVSG